MKHGFPAAGLAVSIPLVLLAASHFCFAAEFQGTVSRVLDGDTAWVTHDGKSDKVRFAWVDAPEHDQDGGTAAKVFTEQLCLGKTVTVKVHGKSYDRFVGEIVLKDGTGVNASLVKAGYAWVEPRYAKGKALKLLAPLEAEARKARRGLWAGDKPIPPWTWRRRGK